MPAVVANIIRYYERSPWKQLSRKDLELQLDHVTSSVTVSSVCT